jgi:hypothetical protein
MKSRKKIINRGKAIMGKVVAIIIEIEDLMHMSKE